MNTLDQAPTARSAADLALLDVAFLLLLLQAGIAVLTAIGAFALQVLAPGSRTLLGSAVVEVGVALLLIGLAGGILRSKRWACTWTVRLEVLVLLGSGVSLLIQFGVALTLAFVVAQVLLPVAILILVLRLRDGFTKEGLRGPRG